MSNFRKIDILKSKLTGKGYKAYKQYWEDQAALDQSPWDQNKVLRLTILTDYDSNLKELQFSNHSLKKRIGNIIYQD